jgi:hypothetical protein
MFRKLMEVLAIIIADSDIATFTAGWISYKCNFFR